MTAPVALDAYTDLMAELLDGEEVISLVFGDFGWAGYREPQPPFVPKDKRGVLLTLEEARPYMRGWTFFCNYGAPLAYATYIWTNRRVLWVTQYDGSTDLDWMPSLPAAVVPQMPGVDMNREELVKLAREAGFTNPEPGAMVEVPSGMESSLFVRDVVNSFWNNLERFAGLVEAKGQQQEEPLPPRVYVLRWRHYDGSASGMAPHAYANVEEAERTYNLLAAHCTDEWKIVTLEVV